MSRRFSIIETVITVKLPPRRIPAPKKDKLYACYPRIYRWFGWLFQWNGGACGDISGRTNTVRHLMLFRWHILTVHRNEYHDRSDRERADEYLAKWSECEKELRGLRLLVMGDSTCPEMKKLLREFLGVDLDEGRIL